MLEELKEQVGKADDRSEAFKKLLGLAEPMLVLQLFPNGEDRAAEVWIEGGKRIVAARVGRSGNTGFLGFLELLTLNCQRFDVRAAADDSPDHDMDINIEDLLKDESQVVNKIKSELWPLTERSVRFSPSRTI